MRWLHLTDLHLSLAHADGQRAALREAIEAIRAAVTAVPVDAVLISGDIANSGIDAEYRLAEELLIGPLRAVPGLATVPFICCPGNHDLDCDQSYPTRLTDWDTKKQELFWTPGEAGIKVRQSVARAFQAYSEFLARNGLVGADPLREVAAETRIAARGRAASIITCNTAWFSHKDIRDQQGAQEPPTAALRDVVSAARTGVGDAGCVLVVGHHPLSWFLPHSVDRLRQLLRQSRALYLHGHDHVVKVDFTNGGALAFGFSASYQSPLDQPPAGPYRNGFAICEIADGSLHLCVRKWDAGVGRWVLETAMPSGVDEESAVVHQGYVVPILHGASPLPAVAVASLPLAAPRRLPPEISLLRPLAAWREADWRDILGRLGTVPLDACKSAELVRSEAQSFLFRAHVGGETWLLGCISGAGHVLSRSEVVNANTDLDEEGVQAYQLVTPGGIADDAKSTYQRFARSGKRLRVVTGTEFANAVLTNAGSKLNATLSSLDGGEASADLAFADGKLWLVIRDCVQNAWFWLADEGGMTIQASHPVVRQVRAVFEPVRAATYSPSVGQTDPSAVPIRLEASPFDRTEYLRACRDEFNTIRYAGLATAGPRLQNVPLTDVYVGADADVEMGRGSTTGIVGAIEGMLDVLRLDPAIRQQLQQQLYRNYGLSPNRETFAAQTVYQRYGSVMILGDPGSGKTCFTKHQILQYCGVGTREPGSWYARHAPVYVPLADASRLVAEGLPMRSVASQLAFERGLSLAPEHFDELAAAGELALFFDGFDEVDRLERRVGVMEWLAQEMPRLRAAGNRMVVTSRPAAVQLVNTPSELRVLSLRGLGEGEIRALAERVLRAQRVVADIKAGHFAEPPPLLEEDGKLVEQILDDCRSSPAIFRLARNPLLLTLLVTIYSNSGRPAAKRHRVYTQAVQTLVAVRARAAGHAPMAESELRKRLGDLALSQFGKGEGAVIPKDQALVVVAQSMQTQLGTPVGPEMAEKFIRDVADTTGLLVIHEGAGISAPAVGFMHHSFFEYYASNGLLRGDVARSLRLLVYEPKWREVLLLLAGLSDERDDVTPLVEAVLALDDEVTPITLENLLIAFDCALEAEVPPERAQRALLKRIGDSVRDGALRGDYSLRDDVGERLARLAALTGSKVLTSFLRDGLADPDVQTRNAFVEFVGAVGEEARLDDDLVVRVGALASSGPESLVPALGAAARCEALRTPSVIEAVRTALKGNTALKHAAAKAVGEAPGLVKGDAEWKSLRVLLDDHNRLIAAKAAAALIRGRLSILPETDDGRRLLGKVLTCLEDDATLDQRDHVNVTFSRQALDDLMSSEDSQDRALGIRLLPWLRDLDAYVYQRLMGIIRQHGAEPQEVVAALAALRHAGSCHGLVTMADCDDIADLFHLPDRLTGSVVEGFGGRYRLRRRDVRLSALRALVTVGTSRVSMNRMLAYAQHVREDSGEFIEVLRALRGLDSPSPDVAEYSEGELDVRLPLGGKREYPRFDEERVNVLVELLELFAEHEGREDPYRTLRFLRAAVDFRVPAEVRRALIVAAAAATVPTEPVVNQWIELLRQPPEGMADVVARGVEEFTRRCRRRLDWVRAVYPRLPDLRQALVHAYANTWRAANSARDFKGVRLVHFRRAITSVEFTHRSYRELAVRQAEGERAASGSLYRDPESSLSAS
jgi:hypothetical protein